jgi:hypothetical protein
MTSPFWNLVYALIAIAVVGFLVVYVISFFRVRFQVIPEEERWVIYRLGRFNRVAGPGWTFIPSLLEKVNRRIDIRPTRANLMLSDMMIYGVPFGCTLNFMYQIDLKRAADQLPGNEPTKVKLTRLAMLSNEQVYNEVRVKARKAFTDAIGRLEVQEPLPKDAEFVQALLPVIPGLPPCNRLLDEVRLRLEKEVLSLGVFLESLHPLTITSLQLGDDIVGSFRQIRIARILRERFPMFSDQDLMQIISNATGLPPFEQRFRFDGAGAGSASIELRDDEHNRRIKFYPTGVSQSGPGSEAKQKTPSEGPRHEPPLTKDDLGILKRVPRAAGGQRAAS